MQPQTSVPPLDPADAAVPSPPGSSVALTVLVAMAVLTPWAFGGAPPEVFRALTVIGLLVSFCVLGLQLRARHVEGPPLALWPLYGIVALGFVQLVPLPPPLHHALAPASANLWHPADPTVAAVLGDHWRPISIHPAATFASAAWGLGLLTLASLAIPALRHRGLRRAALLAVALGGLAVAVYGVVARVAFGPLLYGRYAVPTVAPFGPFVSKNHFAGYVGMVALLTLGLVASRGDKARFRSSAWSWVSEVNAGRGLMMMGGLAAMALSVLVSQSRGGALALGAGLLAFGLFRRRSGTPRRTTLLLGLLAIAVAAVVLPPEPRARLYSLLGPPDASTRYRFQLWGNAFSAFRSSPWLGQGMGAFEYALPRFKTVAGEVKVEHAENDYLELLVEGGLLAGLLVGFSLVILGRGLLGRVAAEGGRRLPAEKAGAAAALTVILTHSLFDFSLRLAACATVAACLLALVTPRSGIRRGPLPRSRTGSPLLLGLALSTGMLLAEPGRRPIERLGEARPGLSARRAKTQLVERLRSCPGDANDWLWVAWLSALGGDNEVAAALARHAAALDPGRPGAGDYAQRLARAAESAATSAR